ncbi:hypothetical protein SUGI_0723840 [Cryptomeria japonica]|nr:hypothetical protein SUGI_0723840 [Cryptomeria japonica]
MVNPLQSNTIGKDVANTWVNDNIKPFYPSVHIKYIAVENEVFANRAYVSYLLTAMNNFQKELSNANLQNDIKVSTPHATSVLYNSFPPSEGTFGNVVATMDNARTYNSNLIKHVLSNAETPKRSGRTIETYIFALFNENQKAGADEEWAFWSV